MKKESLANRITEFTYFYKVVEPLLNKVKGKTAAMMRTKQQQMNSYQDFHRSMQRYEDLNLQTYTEMQAGELILTNPDNMELNIKLQELTSNMQNPYIDLYHWAKGEIFDLQAVMSSVRQRTECEKAVRELERKK